MKILFAYVCCILVAFTTVQGQMIEGQSFKKLKKALVNLSSPFYPIPHSPPPLVHHHPLPASPSYSDSYDNGPHSYPLTRPIHDDHHAVPLPSNSYLHDHLPPPLPKSGPYHHTYGPGRICCADCRRGDITCLARCIRVGCTSANTCASAGDGAYASFCQRTCSVMSGMTLGFLPDPSCRGLCAGEVQRLCHANACQDYGCFAPECESMAPAGCEY